MMIEWGFQIGVRTLGAAANISIRLAWKIARWTKAARVITLGHPWRPLVQVPSMTAKAYRGQLRIAFGLLVFRSALRLTTITVPDRRQGVTSCALLAVGPSENTDQFE
jgi:hypothetical protein